MVVSTHTRSSGDVLSLVHRLASSEVFGSREGLGMTSQRKLSCILAADAAGYSRLMGDDEKATERTLTEYRQVFTQHIELHQGRVVDTAGDSVLAVFDSPVEAVECA